MKIAILNSGILPIPAVLGGAVECMTDFYLEYNDKKKLHEITIYSIWDPHIANSPALLSDVNHYFFIDVSSLKARILRRIHKYLISSDAYYNYFIDYYFEKAYSDIKNKQFDCIILENCPGHVYKLSQRGHKNLILHLNNDLLNSKSKYHNYIFSNLTKIITCSNYIRERVCTIQQNNKTQTLYNAIDVSSFAPKDYVSISRKELGIFEDDFVVVYSGRINKDKGVSELIDAILLLRDMPKIKLLIIGGTFFGNSNKDNDFVLSLKEKAQIIKNKIIFTGFIPYKKLPDYLQLAQIAVIPSIWEEPFGLTVIEAMAAGIPLITTRSGGIPEICEGVATIVDKCDIVNNLANAIKDLYNNPEKRIKMSSNAKERVQKFDKNIFAKKIFETIET